MSPRGGPRVDDPVVLSWVSVQREEGDLTHQEFALSPVCGGLGGVGATGVGGGGGGGVETERDERGGGVVEEGRGGRKGERGGHGRMKGGMGLGRKKGCGGWFW